MINLLSQFTFLIRLYRFQFDTYIQIQQFFENIWLYTLKAQIMFQQHLQGEQQQFVIPPHPKYQFRLTTQAKIKSQTLVIAFYGPAFLFAHSLIPNQQPHSRVNFLKSKQTSLADIFLNQKKSTAYIIFNGQAQKMKQVHFSQFIQQNFQFEKIIVLTHEYVNNLEQNYSNACLQHIKTSYWTEKAECNRYKQGLMGMPAEIIISGEIKKVPVCCYVGLFKDYQLNGESIHEVFGSLVGKSGMDQVSDISQKIKKYNMKKYSNNLYL